MANLLRKNHWIKVHEQKKKRFWTVEFTKSNSYHALKPRRVQLADALGYQHQPNGTVSINFKGAMLDANDDELLDFLSECRKDMTGWHARLKFYENMFTELYCFEISQLSFVSIGIGFEIEDMMLKISYNKLKQVH